jgi:putative hydrolases of HD superfamily
MPQIDTLLQFVDLLHQFQKIERSIWVKNSERKENDSEHSFSLAMLAWYINSTHELGMDTEKLLKYSLAHDLVEVYAGDTFFYHKDQSVIANKHHKEQEALKVLRDTYPEFPELHSIIEQYEMREDAESKFVYALDKIEPVLNIYQDGGRTWKRNNITLEMLREMKSPKVAVDKNVEKIFNQLLDKLKAEEKELFN